MQNDNLRFLVVDDDDVDREMLLRLLGKIGARMEFTQARSLDEARACLDDGRFDCVLLDYHLGGAIGLDLVPDVVAHRAEVCPIVLVTMHQADRLIVEAIRSGVADYIPKSNLDVDQLLSVLRGVMARAAIEEQRRQTEERLRKMSEELREDYEDALLTAADRAEATARAKTLFVANMSHEIRTPLNTVVGLSYLLRKTKLDPAQAELVGKIELASKSLLSVVNNVLDTSKLGERRVSIEHVPLSLAALFADLAAMIEVQIADRPIRLVNSIAPGTPDHVIGDPTRLHQILLNLLTNAVKFTEQGEVRLSVRLAERNATGPQLRFVVADTGIGIAPDKLDRLFAPFEQADETTTRNFGGTGLGLSISRELVALMGGTISATSEQGAGSQFRVEVPLEPVALPLDQPRAPDDDAGERRLEGVRLLLVDDCDINLDIAARILELEGAEVATATNGEEAVDFVVRGEEPVDIVLMDLQMPVLDGIGAFRRIETALGVARPQVIALTAEVEGANGGHVDTGGMDGIISKPFDVEQLAATVRDHVRRGGDTKSEGEGAPLPPGDRDAAGASDWNAMPAIDGTLARAHFGGDRSLFLAALAHLIEEFRNERWIAEEADLALRARQLRRLKGTAGLVGAKPLQAAAVEAEEACAANDGAAAACALERVADELARLRSQAGECFGTQDDTGLPVPHAIAAPPKQYVERIRA